MKEVPPNGFPNFDLIPLSHYTGLPSPFFLPILSLYDLFPKSFPLRRESPTPLTQKSLIKKRQTSKA